MSESSSPAARIKDRLLMCIEVPAVIVLAVMMLHVTANAILRTVSGNPIQSTIEITQYLYLPVLALLGFVAAQARGEHIVADIATGYMTVRTKRVIICGGYLITAAVSAGFAWYGLSEARHAHAIGKTAGVSSVPAWPVHYLIPVAFGVMTVLLFVAAYRALRGAEDEDDFDAELESGTLLEETK